MKQKFGKWFVLVPIGLIIISGTLLLTQFKYLSDMLSGLLFGVGIGLMALALILRKRKPTSC